MKQHHNVLRLINAIGATSSRAEKETLLRDLAALEIGKFALEWAYNPFITYGIKPGAPDGDNHLGELNADFSIPLIMPMLSRLAQRALTGHAADREIHEVMQALDFEGARLLFLILSKDLKCGIAETTINNVIPGLIPTFSVMRAHAYEEKKIKSWPMKAEFKLDGQRNTFLCRDGVGAFFTRSGKIVEALDFMVQDIIRVAARAADADDELRSVLVARNTLNFMLDGEAMMGLFADTGALRRKSAQASGAEFHLYDMMSYDDFDAAGAVGHVLRVRRKWLSRFVTIGRSCLEPEKQSILQIVPQYFVNSHKDVEDFFALARSKTLASYMARGDAKREAELLETTIDRATGKPKVLEGAMIKDPNALYEKRKCNAWLKVKAEETEDLSVVGFYPGEPGTKYENALGGLVVFREGVLVRVGGGFTDAERSLIWSLALEEVARTDKGLVDKDKDATIIRSAVFADKKLIHRLIEVEFHEVTPDGSLRHPRFVRFRDDKDGEIESKERVG